MILSSFVVGFGAATADDLVIADDGRTAGYATLAWPGVPGKSFVLEENDAGVWRVIYQGPDRATTLSGRPDGRYEFRLKADGQFVTTPLSLTIEHHPLSRAWMFFGIGAVMFVLLLAVLIRGSRKPIPQIFPTNAEQ